MAVVANIPTKTTDIIAAKCVGKREGRGCRGKQTWNLHGTKEKLIKLAGIQSFQLLTIPVQMTPLLSASGKEDIPLPSKTPKRQKTNAVIACDSGSKG